MVFKWVDVVVEGSGIAAVALKRCKDSWVRVAGDLGCIEKGELLTAKKDVAEIERMLKALITSLEIKHLNP